MINKVEVVLSVHKQELMLMQTVRPHFILVSDRSLLPLLRRSWSVRFASFASSVGSVALASECQVQAGVFRPLKGITCTMKMTATLALPHPFEPLKHRIPVRL